MFLRTDNTGVGMEFAPEPTDADAHVGEVGDGQRRRSLPRLDVIFARDAAFEFAGTSIEMTATLGTGRDR